MGGSVRYVVASLASDSARHWVGDGDRARRFCCNVRGAMTAVLVVLVVLEELYCSWR